MLTILLRKHLSTVTFSVKNIVKMGMDTVMDKAYGQDNLIT